MPRLASALALLAQEAAPSADAPGWLLMIIPLAILCVAVSVIVVIILVVMLVVMLLRKKKGRNDGG